MHREVNVGTALVSDTTDLQTPEKFGDIDRPFAVERGFDDIVEFHLASALERDVWLVVAIEDRVTRVSSSNVGDVDVFYGHGRGILRSQ